MKRRKSSNVISLRQRKFKKRYGKFLNKKKYLFIFAGIPVLIASVVMIDREVTKYNLASRNIEYKPYYETHKEYILNESKEGEFKELKQYYQKEEKFENYIQERKEILLNKAQ